MTIPDYMNHTFPNVGKQKRPVMSAAFHTADAMGVGCLSASCFIHAAGAEAA